MEGIALQKQRLRHKLIMARKDILPEKKEQMDKKIAFGLFSLKEYKKAESILCYVSLNDEIDTRRIIQNSLDFGKKVAVPKCKGGEMEFFYISSFDELKPGSFGILEPSGKKGLVSNFEKALLIVPGLAFDSKGYRIGYGKGYYDKFISKYNIFSVGLCYNENIFDKLPTDEFDMPVNYVITN